MKMILPSKTLAAAIVAAAIPLAGPTAAAPLSQPLALNSADVGTVEQVQYRRWRSGRWIGPAAGIAAGVAIGSALAPRYYDDGYYAYGAAPGYAGPRYREWNDNYGNGAAATGPGSSPVCPPDREESSAYPSWMCR
jgi:hypothetical protein